MGRWWVIGNIPYFAERGKIASADVYAPREKFAAYGYRPADIKRVPQFPDQQQ